jgi:hypothetical protein
VYAFEGTILVGIHQSQINLGKRQQIVRDYSLREFEVDQYKFSKIVKAIPTYQARLTNVEVVRSYIHNELEEELNEAIMWQDTEKVAEIIEEIADLGHDVQSVEYYLNSERIRFTRLAELDVSSVEPDIFSILNTTPIGSLSGVVREDEFS